MTSTVTTVADHVVVEVVFAGPLTQSLLSVQLPLGATVADAIAKSGIAARHADIDITALRTGVWGHTVDPTHPLRDGDRVEIYRELTIDPREARRQLALSGRTMREPTDTSSG